ncbi:MAG: response regulator [Anaerolineales bacterium]|nr:response regulator [Anaerolineales bacterium]
MTIRILLVDDHPTVRLGLKMLLEGANDLVIVGEAATAEKAISIVNSLRPDVVVIDIDLPDHSGIEAIAAIKEFCPNTAVVVLTIHDDKEYVKNILEVGVSGFVPKYAAPSELITAIRSVARGGTYL